MPPKRRNVYRIDRGAFRGYAVNVRRCGEGLRVYVSEVRVGGRRAALREALRLRDAIESKLPPLCWIRLRTRNNTGVPGVTRVEGVTRAGTPAKPRYQAFWIDAEGRRRTRSFSISVHGDDALRLAVETRRRGVLEAMRVAVRKAGRGRVPSQLPGLEAHRIRRASGRTAVGWRAPGSARPAPGPRRR